MNDFEDFDPGAWFDDTSVLLQAPVSHAGERALKAVRNAFGIACVGVAAAFAALGTHSALSNTLEISSDSAHGASSMDRPRATAPDPSSMFATHEINSTWQAALQLLESRGADVNAMLRAGADNIERYHSNELQFPSVFPSDE